MRGMRRKWSCRRPVGLVHCGLRGHAGDGGDVVIGIVEGIGRGEEWHDVRSWLGHRVE